MAKAKQKKMLAMALAASVAMSAVPVVAFAEETEENVRGGGTPTATEGTPTTAPTEGTSNPTEGTSTETPTEGTPTVSVTLGAMPTAEGSEENTTEITWTETTETERKTTVTIGEPKVEIGTPSSSGTDGTTNDGDGYNYYWYDYGVNHGYAIGTVKWTVVDAEGNPIENTGKNELVGEFQLKHDNFTPENKEDDPPSIGGIYCTDMSTDARDEYKYRKENLEDADYYTEAEAKHLRAIMNHGYTWDADDIITSNEDPTAEKNSLDKLREELQREQSNGNEILQGFDFSGLTDYEAGMATQMAIWKYGNRVELENGQSLEIKSENAKIDAVYQYLIGLTEKAVDDEGNHKETQIIDEDEFLKDMELTIGNMVKDHINNQDKNPNNDVYDVGLKFSLVVTPDKNKDDLVVKVLDNAGNVLQAARIAGTNGEGETYKTISADENGNYTLTGLELQENSNIKFNLKLEGTQYLTEGVYVFESEVLDKKTWLERRYAYENPDDSTLTEEEKAAKKAALAEQYDTDESKKRSQSLISRYEGTAEVDVAMTIDLKFDVQEGTVTKEHHKTEKKEEKKEEEKEEEKKEESKEEEKQEEKQEEKFDEDEGIVAGASEDIDEGILAGDSEEVEEITAPAGMVLAAKTNDAAVPWAAAGGFSLLGLLGTLLFGRRKNANR